MKRLAKVIMLLALAAVICLPGIGLADYTTIGEPTETGSWSQQFNESGVGLFNIIEAFSLSGNSFEPTPFTGFSNGGWSGSLVNPTYALGTGPAVTSLNWWINFFGAKASPLVFDFLAWNNDVIRERAHASWSGSSWTITVLSGEGEPGEYDRSAVPIPAAVWLLGTGLVGLFGIRRRFVS